MRNSQRKSKFQPLFAPEQYVVTGISDHGRKLEIERLTDGQTLLRHPDDLKTFNLPHHPAPEKTIYTPKPWEILDHYNDDQAFDYSDWHGEILPNPVDRPEIQPQEVVPDEPAPHHVIPQLDEQVPQLEPRRSDRNRKAPDRLGTQVYDEQQPLEGENEVIDPWWPGYPREAD